MKHIIKGICLGIGFVFVAGSFPRDLQIGAPTVFALVEVLVMLLINWIVDQYYREE